MRRWRYQVSSVAWASTADGPIRRRTIAFRSRRRHARPSQRPTADFLRSSARVLDTVDLPVVAGRFSTTATYEASARIVNEAFVRGYLQGRSLIRSAFHANGGRGAREAHRARNHRRGASGQGALNETVTLSTHVPLAQNRATTSWWFDLVGQRLGAGAFRAATYRDDKVQLVSVRDVMTLDDVARDATGVSVPRSAATTFAGLALVAILGPRWRTRSATTAISVFDASAHDRRRLRLVGLWFESASGLLVGLFCRQHWSRLLATVLFGAQPDPLTFAAPAYSKSPLPCPWPPVARGANRSVTALRTQAKPTSCSSAR